MDSTVSHMLFQADDEGSTPFIRSFKALRYEVLFFMPKCLCYKDLGEIDGGSGL